MVVKGLTFKKFITSARIQKTVDTLAAQISTDYKGKVPLFLPILNGSFIFGADLVKEVTIDCKVSFVKVSSYSGTQSSGQLKTLIGHDESVFGQDIIIVEDIVDTGRTLSRLMDLLKARNPRSLEICALLHKHIATELTYPTRFVGFDAPHEFLVGYGLDHAENFRHLPYIASLQ